MLAAFYSALRGELPSEVEERLAEVSVGLNEYGYDRWGFSPGELRRKLGLGYWLYKHYFRVKAHGIERVPQGRGLLIGNHSSQVAYDGIVVTLALLLEGSPPRTVRAMIEKFFQHQPFVNVFMARHGQLTGLPRNCEGLLADDHLIMVFPEGGRGGGKTYWERYELQPFGQGFMRLAMKMQAPIVPFGFIGGEEACPSLLDVKPLARLFGIPYVPLTPTIVPLPLPAKCSVYFGEPMRFAGSGNEEDSEIEGHVAEVKSVVAGLVARGLEERQGVFF